MWTALVQKNDLVNGRPRESRAVLILAAETVMRHQHNLAIIDFVGGRCLMMRILSFALLPAVAALAASPPRACLRSALMARRKAFSVRKNGEDDNSQIPSSPSREEVRAWRNAQERKKAKA